MLSVFLTKLQLIDSTLNAIVLNSAKNHIEDLNSDHDKHIELDGDDEVDHLIQIPDQMNNRIHGWPE